MLDPVRALVSFGTGQDVDQVYVDGNLIVDSGNVLNADEEKLRAAAPKIMRKLHAAATERDPIGQYARFDPGAGLTASVFRSDVCAH